MDKEGKKILGLTTCSHGLVHLFEGVLPPLIPIMISQFNANYFQLGLIVTVFSYAFGLGSLPGGLIGDRVGPRKLISFYLFSSAAIGIFILFSNSLFTYGVLMGLLGLSASVYHAASNALISLRIKEIGHAFGLHGIAGSLGVALAPVISASMGARWGWKVPHVALGLFALCLAFFSLGIRDIQPRRLEGRKEDKAQRGIVILILFFSTAAFLGITYKAVMTFLPSYMGERVSNLFGITLNKVTLGGTVATIALLSGSLGQYLAGRFVGRYQGERLYLLVIILGALFSLLMYWGWGPLLVLSTVGFSLFYFATQPIQNYLLSTYVSQQKRAASYGLHFSITFGIGSVAAALGGLSADKFGLASVFLGSTACFVISGVLCFILLRLRGN